METTEEKKSLNFIEEKINTDLAEGKFENRVHTRFPPEPNGYLHIGHAKAICLNFGIAKKYGGECNLRFDDTNPSKEETEYVDAIKEDIKWLGFDWGEKEYYTSDYFETLYGYAVKLIEKGLAYVDDQTSEQIAEQKGTTTKPGTNSPFRDRSVEENRTLFAKMRNGEFEEGTCILRAKIDMGNENMLLRDPLIYRIKKVAHHRTGADWCIYPIYDFAHGQSDSIEHITHSLCSLEFEVHRPLYNWFIENLEIFPSEQSEFARLNLSYTILSKRKLLELVEGNHVTGWDDPRMPTLSGLRRRGYSPEAIVALCDEIGVLKRNGLTDIALLEHHLKTHLNKVTERRMAVLNPLKVVITNYPEGESELLAAVNNPEDETAGKRQVPFSKELYIERDDFMENAPRKFFRLSEGREVRLRYAYYITCNEVIKDAEGNITELHCTYDAETKGGKSPDGRKVKATLHWVSVEHAVDAAIRLYDRLFETESPDTTEEGGHFTDNLNPNSVEVIKHAKLEPELAKITIGVTCQFERLGYFCKDKDSTNDHLVFNRTVALRDSWAKKK
ncbi:MAG: glutamine--tRNA ligase/YqeY domain fusion protein [Flavobacteriales bacterium]|nr:glutamine--tRNA ligase/YqeY domain fusion protein [Flavobacteriales bacterium]